MSKSFFSIGETKWWKKYLILISFLLFVFGGFAQHQKRIQKHFDEARQLLAQQDYSLAIERCEKILERNPEFLDARLLLADIFYETKDTPREIFQLKKALEKSEMPLIMRRLGDALLSNGNYGEALDYFQAYLDAASLSTERKAEVNRKMENCRFALHAMENPVEFYPERLPNTVNSVFDEYWPSLSVDQQQLVITRLVKRAGQPPQEDFFFSVSGPEEWSETQPVSELNTPENEGAQSLSADGNLFFFTACNRPGGAGSCDIYYSLRNNGQWSPPVNAGSPLNTAGWEAQPSISSDGRFLYFTSNRSGGKGEKDLWRAECLGFGPDGRLKWKAPVNLGDSVNTSGNETSPFIHAGNMNFYFASDFHTGMGGFDLFMSSIQNDSVFSAPQNLGYPVNTSNDEQGLHISADGMTAFFSSARDSLSGLDIYSFRLDESIRPSPATYVRTFVFDAETREPVQAQIELLNLVHPDKSPRMEMTDTQGECLLCLPVGKNYSFSVSKEGYLFYSNTFDLREQRQVYEPYELEIGLTPVKVGAEMNLYNIYFETDSFRILPESEPELQKLVVFLNENSRLDVEIQGHTDDTGDAGKNLELSEKRARSVVEFLVLQGIRKERLQWAGYGEKQPVSDNSTPEGRRLNRRTTIKILGE
ncbi:flagellar motor protein MotB [Mariniphaga sediminis]|uniref:Flagellar motor protein MotB n=1 Tax=Mariniphaga sediminis TaxID=1628158 RepID=A0A399D0E4_9BACT|nr:OmpA family protein [Mariniphaga sediminis]RIH65485.1 flagellar motor protein MotB [Mariniphaga sediminis]